MTELAAIVPYLLPPALGAFIGYVTNYIAIRMLFRPLRPWRVPSLRTFHPAGTKTRPAGFGHPSPKAPDEKRSARRSCRGGGGCPGRTQKKAQAIGLSR